MKKTRKYLLCLLTLALMLFLPAAAAQAASGQQPGYVSSITAKVSGNNQVTVTWKKAKNATSYRVYYKQAGGKCCSDHDNPYCPVFWTRRSKSNLVKV